MLPMSGVPEPIRQGMARSGDLLCREAGFDHVSRDITGLILSPKTTLEGIYALQGWPTEQAPARGAMPEAVCAAGWDAEQLMPYHRAVVAPAHRGRGRAVLRLDWPYAHHERSPNIGGVQPAWDHVERRMVPYPTVVTAVIARHTRIDGVEVVVQSPAQRTEEAGALQATVRQSDEQREEARQRVLEVLSHLQHRRADKKGPEIALAIVQPLEQEAPVPQAHYACAHGGLPVDLTRSMERVGKHWVSESECARPIPWQGQWRRVEAVATRLRHEHPESVRRVTVRCRHGDTKQGWPCTKVVRLTRYGAPRMGIVHETADLSDAPRFLLSEARHWERGRVIETWSDRWAAEIFHECGKQVTGLEAAQGRKEEAVTRHFRLSCGAQSLVQEAPASGTDTERLAFAKGETTVGQRVRTITREVLQGLRQCAAHLCAQGRSWEAVLELLIPA